MQTKSKQSKSETYTNLSATNIATSENVISKTSYFDSLTTKTTLATNVSSENIITTIIDPESYINFPDKFTHSFAVLDTSEQGFTESTASGPVTTQIVFGTTVFDTDSGVSLGDNSYTIPKTGVWEFTVAYSTFAFVAGASPFLQIDLVVNGTAVKSGVMSSQGNFTGYNFTFFQQVDEDDVITLNIYQPQNSATVVMNSGAGGAAFLFFGKIAG